MILEKGELVKQYLSTDSYKTTYISNFQGFRRLFFLINLAIILIWEWIKIKRHIFDFNSCQIASLRILNCFEKVGFKFELIGLRNLNKINSPCVFIANHMSMIETLVLPGLLMHNRKLSVVAKNELKNWLFLSSILKSIKTIFISRENKRADLVVLKNQASHLIRNNFSILIFPQSTRCIEFIPKDFRKVGLRIAYDNKSHLMPIAVKSDAWEIGKLFKDFGKFNINKTVHISFGEVMFPNSYNINYHDRGIKFISENLKAWNNP